MNKKNILIIVLLFFVTTAIFVFLKNKDLYLQAKQIKKERIVLQKTINNIAEVKKNQNILYEIEQKMEKMFVDLKTPVEVIIYLEKIAEQNNLSLDLSIQEKNKETNNDWPYLNLQVKVQGNFFNYMNFWQKMENSPFLLEVLNIVVQKNQISFIIKIFGEK